MIPGYAWAYLALLCLIGAGGFVLQVRAGHVRTALLRIAAIVVLGYGVLLFFRGSGAGVAYALALLCAIARARAEIVRRCARRCSARSCRRPRAWASRSAN